MTSVPALQPRIYAILSGPSTDLETISAKRVRKQLQAEDPLVTPDFIRDNKAAIDQLIATVFNQVKEERQTGILPPANPGPVGGTLGTGMGGTYQPMQGYNATAGLGLALPNMGYAASASHAGSKRKFEDLALSQSSPGMPLQAHPTGYVNTKQELSDAQLARQLSAELNGHSTRGAVTAPPGSLARKAGKKKTKKSKEEVEDSGGEGGERPKKKARGGGFQKPYALSPALQELTGETALPRPLVVKALWDHIKANQLQNPQNRKEILCDDKMRAVFGMQKIDMFRMNKELGKYLGDVVVAGEA
ncbi:SWIB-domain-containing protein [Dacryopinax primogenitus]|uniref:SWIB-domain-containing protein n=1 Tax=Dacryopinax primogenitus (strain DJM 731) TaxID=1858805 RepID=M5FU41_DACPD|nr:SWIB-domain-containing protein [Dacryopinax primogenitus]EJT96741.1 SWIB-domain-containing protein [Dacryopinax primogenitus]